MKELLENQYASSYISHLDTHNLFVDSAFFKNAAFLSEKEWRILLDDDELYKTNDDWAEYYNWGEDNENKNYKGIMMDLIPKGIEFIGRKKDICSYMDLSFKEYNKIIDEVVLGPNCRLSVDDIVLIMNHFLFEYFNDTTVKKSKCPYIARC